MLGALSQFGPALQGKQGSEALRSRHHLCSIEGFLQPFDRAGFVQRVQDLLHPSYSADLRVALHQFQGRQFRRAHLEPALRCFIPPSRHLLDVGPTVEHEFVTANRYWPSRLGCHDLGDHNRVRGRTIGLSGAQ